MKKLAVKKVYFLSPMQEGMLFHGLLNKHSNAYFEQMDLTIRGTINVDSFEKVFNILVERYDILRTNFFHKGMARPGQVVLKERKVKVYYEDKSNLNAKDIEGYIEEFKEEDKEKGFDLTKDMLMRISIIKTNDYMYRVIWDFHHIILDGWSMGIFIKEFLGAYQSLLRNEAINLGKVEPYENYIKWLESQEKDGASKFWNKYLEGYEQKALVPRKDFKEVLGGKYIQKKKNFTIGKELTEQLEYMAKENHVTLSTIIETVWGIVLCKYNNTNDVVFGKVVSGRSKQVKGIEEMLGLFINAIPLRVKYYEGQSYKNLIGDIQESNLASERYDYYPLAQIQANCHLKQNLLDSIIVFENYPMQKEIANADYDVNLGFEICDSAVFEQTNYDFNITVLPGEDLELIFSYNALVYDSVFVESIKGHIKRVLSLVVQNSNVLVNNIDILTDEERKRILYEFNATKKEYSKDKTIYELFEEQVERTPDNVAVVFEEEHLTYRELNNKANQLARVLRNEGVKPNTVVGIMVERSLEMIIGIIGILKAGGAYLPLDLDYPSDRIKYMLEDSDTSLLLSNHETINNFNVRAKTINIKDKKIYKADSWNVEKINKGEDLAYIIYTSGTTGKPKGVMVNQKSIYNTIQWRKDEYIFNDEDTVLQLFSYSFDGFITSFFTPIVSGAKVIILDELQARNPERIIDCIKTHNVTHFITVPALFEAILENAGKDECKTLKIVTLAGENLSQNLIRKFKSKNLTFEIVNEYGPTEDSVACTIKRNIELSEKITIGRPIANNYVYILSDNRLQPIGVAGELCISGEGLARGYLNRPELTTLKFVENPFENRQKMYRTGDLARWLPDGNIEFLGRIDYQVKIRGYRIELGEIENMLLKHVDIKEAVLVAKEKDSGDKYLCAYVVPVKELTISQIRDYLSRELPEYMIPSYFVMLDRVPRTLNNKVDRKALPEPDGNINTGKEYEAPQNEVQQKLATIWQDVLDVDKVSINDNFFELGGHSLKATVVVSRIHKQLNIDLPLREIFNKQTIKELAKHIKSLEENIYTSIERVEEKECYRASSAQKRLYLLSQLEGAGTAYNLPSVMIVEGILCRDRFETTIKGLIQRHETLRTSFEMIEGKIFQRVHKEVNIDIGYVEAEEERVDELVNGFVQPFDLSKAPLLRTKLIKIAEERHILLFDMHHIISDGTSLGILTREFAQLYKGNSLPELRLHYRDYSEWQMGLFDKGEIKKQEEYWVSKFEGEIPVLNMQTDYSRPTMQSFEGDVLNFEVEEKITRGLEEIAKDTGSTMYMVLLSAYNVLLSKYTGQEDIIVGSPIAGRPHTDLENIIGMFVNTLAMRNYPQGEKRFNEFLVEVKENSLKAYENQDFQFEELIDKLDIRRDISRNPLFDTMFVLQNIDIKEEMQLDNIRFKPYDRESKVSKFDLSLYAMKLGNKLNLSIEYCTKLFKGKTIKWLKEHFVNILKEIVKEPNKRLSEIDILTEEEKNRILYEFNDTKAEYPNDKTIQELFEEQVERTPDNIAVVFEDKQLTYKELNEKANQLSRLLRNQGLMPGRVAGIMIDRSVEMIVGIIGVLKAGGAYLPVDPSYPEERKKYMLMDSEACILLTKGEIDEVLFEGKVINLEHENAFYWDGTNVDNLNNSNDMAYVIYTSGTTGIPKGAIIEHKNVVRLLFNNRTKFDFSDKDVWTMFHSFCFDFSVWEMYGALLYGGNLIIVPKIVSQDPQAYLKLLKEKKVTILNQIPSVFYNLAIAETVEVNSELSLRYVIFGGEALKPAMLKEWKAKYPKTKLINMYGITETTVHVTYKEITDKEIESNISNIGVPIPTLTTYIVDKNMKLLPVGIPGELCVGGEGVGRGYIRRQELTKEKFIQSPFIKGERLYRSGDLARFLHDGDIEYLGRIDQQVKIRGFRIELGEIEHQMLKHCDIKEALVIARDDGGEKYLCAYIVSDKELTVSEVREHLLIKLPQYMIPSYFVTLDRIPLTSNGKVDTKMLPEPDGNINTGKEYIAYRNEEERILVSTWQEVLGVEKVSVNDNFFELGGDSIKSIQVISRIQKYGMKLEMKNLFKYPTIGELSKYVTTDISQSEQGIVEGEVKLTPIQKWFFEMNVKDMHHWNQSVMLHNKDGFDDKILEKLFKKIVEHHDALRMVYKNEDGLIQYNRGIEDDLFTWQVMNLYNEEDYKILIENEAQRLQGNIDLTNGPLVKVSLFKTKEGDHLLIIIHHLVIDGVSWRILFEDLAAGYRQLLNNDEIKLQDKTDSYREWAEKLYTYGDSKELLNEKSYWDKIEEINIKPLPKDNEVKERKQKDSNSFNISMSRDETELLLKNVNQAYNTEINDILLTALGLAIKEWTGENKVLISLEGHGREEIIKDVNISRTIGWFTSMYPVLLDVEKSEDISYLIKSVKESIRRIPKKGIGYGILKYISFGMENGNFKSKINPEISFNYLGQFDQDGNTDIFGISSISTGTSMSSEAQMQHTLNINGMIAGELLEMDIQYDRNQYDEETIENLAGYFKENLKNIIEHCAKKEVVEQTPSDIGDIDLTLKEFDSLINKINKDNPQLEIQASYYLSPMQEGIFFHSLLNKESNAYFVQMDLTANGSIDIEVFEKSFNILVERYDILRTNFFYEGVERPRQVVLKERNIKVQYEDISNMEAQEKVEYLQEFRKRDKEKGFDLEKDILLRISIIKVKEEEYRIILSHHHITMDGWGMGIIIKDFFTIYQSLIKNIPLHLDKAEPYINYITWLENQDKDEAGNYWNKYLEEYEQKAIVAIKNNYKVLDGEYKQKENSFKISKGLTVQLENIAKQNNVTLSTIIETVWGILLGKYNNTDDVVFGKVVSGRPPEVEGIEKMLGLFINTIPVRVKQNQRQSFIDLIKVMQNTDIYSSKYDYYPLAEIQGRSPLKQNLLDNIIVFENYPIQREIGDANKSNKLGFDIVSMEVFDQTNYDFNIIVIPGEELGIRLSYNELVYESELIKRVQGHIITVLDTVGQNSDILVQDIDILTDEEKNQILFEFNNTTSDYPRDKTLHELFEEQVERTPDNTAVVYEDKKLTYRELNEKANQLARVLRDRGLKPENKAGIMVDRSIEMIICLIGVLKAGGAYLPIDPSYPEERIKHMLQDSEATILLTKGETKQEEFFDGIVINLDDEKISYEDNTNVVNINKPNNMAYIIYTSGTTGLPKGAIIEHRNVVRLLFNDNMKFDFSHEDIWTMFHSFSFDFSVWEMYGALLYGGKLVIVPKIVSQDPKAYLKLLKNEKVTVLNQIPSVFYNLSDEESKNLEKELSLRYIIFGGEALKPTLLKGWKTKYPQTKLINMYGITETTVHVTYKEITENEIGSNVSNIGVPIPTLTTYIMDKNIKLLPVGIAGELCVGGEGVGRGYINRPELTKAKFIQNPFVKGERLYRSGDLARFLPNGDIEYLGRIDQQVKIRGFRIELGEIESQLLKHEDIKEAVVIARENNVLEKYLCGYIVSDKELTVSEIREHLLIKLPEYMIPAYFITLDKIPLTTTGKVDRKMLPEPDGNINTGKEYLAPQNETEEKLVATWQEVLGIEKLGINDNFFELGGDSIKAIQVISRLQKYGMKLEMKNLFKYPILRDLGQYVTLDSRHCEQGTVTGEIKLTPIQKWFFEVNFKDMHHWNQSVMLYGKHGFNNKILKEVFMKIVEHHDALRMIYKDKDTLIQYNRGIEDSLLTWQIIDLNNETEYKKIIEDEANKLQSSIDLTKGPLMKVSLFKTIEGDHLLIIIHHLVIDGVSWRILFEDLATAYKQLLNNEEIKLQDKTDSFKEWSDRLYTYAHSKELLREEMYWSKLEEVDIKPLPKDYEVEVTRLKDSNSFTISLSKEDTELLLKNVNQAYITEINDILLAALGLSLKKWTGNNKVLINMEGHGREEIIKDINISRTIGWFTSMYPVLLDVEKSDDISYLIKSIKESIRRIPNKGIGYGILKYITSKEKRSNIKSLSPEISFNYLGQFDQDVNNDIFVMSQISSGISVSLESQMQYTLNINGMISGEVLGIEIQYNKNQYNDDTIKTFANYYIEDLKKIISHCANKEEKEQTPSDVGDSDLTLEELDSILDFYE